MGPYKLYPPIGVCGGLWGGVLIVNSRNACSGVDTSQLGNKFQTSHCLPSPPVSAVYDVLRRNCVSFSEGVRTEQFLIWTPNLDDPPFPPCGIGEGRDPGEMKASVHVVTTVYYDSVYLQSSVVVMGREHHGRDSKDCLVLGMRGTILSGISCKQLFRFHIQRPGVVPWASRRFLAAVGMRGFVWM